MVLQIKKMTKVSFRFHESEKLGKTPRFALDVLFYRLKTEAFIFRLAQRGIIYLLIQPNSEIKYI